MAYELRVDRIRCDGAGLCAELLPEIVTLDDWGYPILRQARVPDERPVGMPDERPGSVPDEVLDHARRAVDACPVLALRLSLARASSVAPSRGTAPAGMRRQVLGT